MPQVVAGLGVERDEVAGDGAGEHQAAGGRHHPGHRLGLHAVLPDDPGGLRSIARTALT